ncbi:MULTISPECIES: hypothetical protein [unclassified Mesorhizobium]|nr:MULTISPECIES: hypothetical protein [unclassified Mesorhizobium]ESZ07244.1 hypothetical protein X736_13205 [Mesorhizobium sp. L2C089B000]WJI52980.1 hypothetical protein NLY44_10080 [Mesorhizobium sp. C089B]
MPQKKTAKAIRRRIDKWRKVKDKVVGTVTSPAGRIDGHGVNKDAKKGVS